MIQLGEHFRHGDRSRHSEWLRQQQWFIKARRDRDQQEKIADRLDDDILALAVEVVLATQIQIEEFKAKLDTYDEATVIALMENQEMLDAVRTEIQSMLARAYVMEDDRRVFKSEDGSFVIDEFGENVSHDEINFDMIPDDNPSAETFMRAKQAEGNLLAERQKIHEFQEKLDTAHEKIADGEVSKSELDELDADLTGAMPPSVKAHVVGFDKTDNTPIAKAAFATSSNPIVSDKLMPESELSPNHDPKP